MFNKSSLVYSLLQFEEHSAVTSKNKCGGSGGGEMGEKELKYGGFNDISVLVTDNSTEVDARWGKKKC